jgi:preprotein translocase subunit YajC
LQGLLSSVFWLVVLFVFMYFMLVRPQQKHNKMRLAMLAELKKGDEVITVGGFYGKIVELTEDTMFLEIAENLRVKMQRDAVNVVLADEEEITEE